MRDFCSGVLKSGSGTGDWPIVDIKRQGYNDASGHPVIWANLSSAEQDVDTMQGQADILAMGQKLRSAHSSINSSGVAGIGVAFVNPLNPRGRGQARGLPN